MFGGRSPESLRDSMGICIPIVPLHGDTCPPMGVPDPKASAGSPGSLARDELPEASSGCRHRMQARDEDISAGQRRTGGTPAIKADDGVRRRRWFQRHHRPSPRLQGARTQPRGLGTRRESGYARLKSANGNASSQIAVLRRASNLHHSALARGPHSRSARECAERGRLTRKTATLCKGWPSCLSSPPRRDRKHRASRGR